MTEAPPQQQQIALRLADAPSAKQARDGGFVEVAITVRVFTSFTYRVPVGLEEAVQPGVRVLVPFRGRPRTGLALARTGPPDDEELLSRIVPVGDALDAEPLISETTITFLQWAARYYNAPIGEVIRMAVPSVLLQTDARRMVSLTQVGRQAMEAGVVQDALHKALLMALQLADEPLSVDALRKQVRGLTFTVLSLCEKAGWVTSLYVSDRGEDAGVKTETIIRLMRDPYVDERLGKRQEEILIRLQAYPTGFPMSLSELRQSVKKPYQSLRRLEQRGIIVLEEEEVYRDPFAGEPVPAREIPEMTADQARVVGEVRARIDDREFGTYLLHGVTGSGKTEVYIRLIETVRAQGKGAIVLLPEIGLTPQFVAVFRSRFDESIAVLHSRLTDGERYDQWRQIRRGEVRIVIGARSALFAPMEKIGIIIVDEEHDSSFKQERGCRYNARDLAQVRGRFEGAVVILGSATPAVESYLNARQTKIGYLPMASRVAERPLPDVELIDMREAPRAEIAQLDQRENVISQELADALVRTVRAKEQVILFLNRRGHSPFVQCRSCGAPASCPNCSVTLTYHDQATVLRCHYCDYIIRMPEICPVCESPDFGFLGVGTEKLLAILRRAFPGVRIARLDRDSGKQGLQIIRRFREHQIDVLIGTQMVTKGHDVHNVTLVGVIMADLGLNMPDFRSGERTFQILTQVAGRAGRGEKPGRVLIQTYSPWHYALEAARHQSYNQFVQHELQARRELAYPPFASLSSILFEGSDEQRTVQAARAYADVGRELFARNASWQSAVSLLGPAQAPLARLRGMFRWQILLKGKARGELRDFLGALLEANRYYHPREGFPGVKIVVDIDPQSLL